MLSSRSKGSQQMGSKAKSESRSNLYYTLPEHLPFLDLARNHGVPFISLTKGASTAAAASNNSPFPNDINSTAMNDFFNSLSNSTLFSNNNGVVSNNNAHEKHPTNRKTSEPSPISSPSTSIISKDQYIQLAKQEEHLLEQIFRNCTHGQSKLPKNFFFNILNMMIYEYSIDMEEILRLDSIQYPPTTNAHHLLRSPTTTKTHHTNFSHNNMPYPYANVNKNNNFNNSHSIKKSASTQSLQSVGNNNNNNNSNNANADSLSCKIPNSPSTSSLLAGLHHPSSSNRATNLGTTNDIAVFSQQWFDGFLQRHAELRNRVSKSVGTCDIDTFDLWFCEYLSGIRDRKIETSNIYNMVDTGIYRGSKNDEFLRNCDSDEHNNESGNKTNNNNNISDDYTEDEHKVIRDPGNAGYFLPLGVAKLQRAQMNKHNKKYPLSVIETICADGSSLAPFVIINDQLINQNSQSDLSQELVQEYKSKEWKFEYTPDGWTSANEAYLWLVNHFDPLTRAKLSHPNAPRALVLAGELRYLSFSFFKYAAQHNIALFFMPAKTCEVLQPFTVGPGKQFQTMGGFFSFSSITLDDQTIDDQKRDDNINNNNNNNIINRPEGLTLSINSNKGKQPSIQWSNFFEMIMQARFVILNHKKISDSWKLAGLSPFNPSLVVGIKFPKIKDPPLLVKVLQLKYDGNIPLINNNNNNNKINKSPSISSNLSLPNLNNSNKKKNNNNDLSSSISLRKRKASATISTLNNTTNVTNVNNLLKKGTTYSNNSLDGKIIPSTTTVGPPSLAGGDVTGQVGGSNSLRLKQLLMRMKSLVPQDSADFAISFNMYNKLVAELEQIVVKLESESASLLKKSKISFNGNNNSVDNNNNNNNNNNNKMIDQNLFNSLLFSKFTNEGGNNNNNNNNFSIDIDTMFDIKQLEMNQSNINAHNINNNMPSSSSSASLSIKHNKLQQQQSTNNDLKSHAEWLQDLYKSQQNHQKQLMNMKSEESNESKNKSKVINNNNNNEKRNNNNIIIKNPQLDLFANSYSVIGPDFCDEINELMNMNNNLFYDNRSSITSTTINNNNNNNNGFNMSDGLIKNSDKLLMNIYNNTSSSSNYSTTMTTTTTTTKTSNNLKNNNISPPPPPSITPSSSSNSPSEGISSPHNKKSPNIYNNNTTNTTSSGNGNAAIIMPSSSSPSTNSMFSMGMKYKNNNHR